MHRRPARSSARDPRPTAGGTGAPGRSRLTPRRWIIAAVLTVTLCLAVVWKVVDDRIERIRGEDVTRELELVRDSSVAAVANWEDERLADARWWASDPTTIAAALELLGTPRDELRTAAAQRILRDRLGPYIALKEMQGIFVVAPDGTNLASTRDANVGVRNLVAATYPDVFERLLAGEPTITPPQLSDVPIGDGEELDPTMFVGAPITVDRNGDDGDDEIDDGQTDEIDDGQTGDDSQADHDGDDGQTDGEPDDGDGQADDDDGDGQTDGEVVAVLLFRLVPDAEIAEILPLGETRPGHPGHGVTVFDATGNALASSAGFDTLDPVEVGDVPIEQLVAEHPRATTFEPVERDAHDVIASWRFDPELGVGALATLDADEALTTLRADRRAWVAFIVATWMLLNGLLLIAVSLRERRAHHREIAARERRYRSLVDPSPDPVLRLRPDGEVVATNPAADRQLCLDTSTRGRRVGDLANRHPLLAELERRWPTIARMTSPAVLERVRVRHDTAERFYRLRVVPELERGAHDEFLVVVTETTDAVVREQRLESLALVDSLTGLVNRVAIADRLSVALRQLTRSGPDDGVAVMMIDLDHFKAVNDALGHQAGDQILVAAGQALVSAVRDNDSVGRLGGDEFVIICEHVTDVEMADELARRVSEALNSLVVEVGAAQVEVSGSVGVAWSGRPLDVDELLLRADRAMLRSKAHRGSGHHGSDHGAIAEAIHSDGELTRDLFGVLDRHELELHYQPIVDTAGRITAAEALLRWRHPSRGLLDAGRFLRPLLETGFIGPVGRWATGEAIAQAERWRDAGTPIQVHVNLSPVELAGGAIDALAEQLGSSDLDPTAICIEVTEQSLNGTLLAPGSITRLAETGVEIALDDFGTGVSSIDHLRHPALRSIKLDRSFVQGIDRDTTDRAILIGLVQIARDLDLDLIAEGVETPSQLDGLVDIGCRRFQGWLYGAAVPPDELDPTQRLGPNTSCLAPGVTA